MFLECRFERIEPNSSSKLCLGNFVGPSRKQVHAQSITIITKIATWPKSIFTSFILISLILFSAHHNTISPLSTASACYLFDGSKP